MRACQDAGVAVPVPGASALLAALAVSGQPSDRLFEGFVLKGAARENALRRLAGLEVTSVIFEAPHRVVSLESLAGLVDADRELTLCRELTKRFETVRRGQVGELLEWVRGDKDSAVANWCWCCPAARGEQLNEQDRALAKALLSELPVSRAVLAAHTGLKRQDLYNYLEEIVKVVDSEKRGLGVAICIRALRLRNGAGTASRLPGIARELSLSTST